MSTAACFCENGMDTFERSDIHFVNAELNTFTKEKQTAPRFTHKQDSSRRFLLALNFRQMILCVQLKAIVHVEGWQVQYDCQSLDF